MIKMRYLASLLLLCSALTHAAPPDGFALVHDADGHTNLRESPDLNAKVLAKIPNGTPLECVGEVSKDNPNFCTALLQQTATGDYGFIHRSRLIFPASDKNFVTLPRRHTDFVWQRSNGTHRRPPHPPQTQRLFRYSPK